MGKYQVEDSVTGKKYVFEGDSPPEPQDIESHLNALNPPEIGKAKPYSTIGQLGAIAQSPSLNLTQKVQRGISTLFPPSPSESIANAQNVNAISGVTGQSLQQLNANNQTGYNQAVNTPGMIGMNRDPSYGQVATVAAAPMIGAGIIENPAGSLFGLGLNSTLGTGLNKLGNNFVPSDISPDTKQALDTASTIAQTAGTMGAYTPVAQALGFLGNKFGAPMLAKTMRFMTGTIPEEYATRALEDPTILNPKVMKQRGEEATNLYKNVIQPLRDNPDVRVDMKSVQQVVNDQNIQNTKTGKPSPEVFKMSGKEQGLIRDWSSEIGLRAKGAVKTDFSDVESLRNKIDSELEQYYNAREKTKLTDKSIQVSPFERISIQLRKALSDSLKNVIIPDGSSITKEDAANAIGTYSNYLRDKSVANSFKGLNASFFKGMPVKIGLMALGIKSLGAAAPAYIGTMPAAWGKGIQAGGGIGQGISQFPQQLNNMINPNS